MNLSSPAMKRFAIMTVLGLVASLCTGCIVRVPGGYGYRGHHHHYDIDRVDGYRGHR